MNVLLDTLVVVWWLEAAGRLSRRAAILLANRDNTILISPAVGWELAVKVNLGKFKPSSILDGLDRLLEREEFSELPIMLDMAVRAGLLPLHHKDPFDRMLVAQARALNIPILSADASLNRYDVKRLW